MMKFTTNKELSSYLQSNYNLIAFDLDNTIYDEFLFLRSVYKNISYLSFKKDSKMQEESFKWLIETFIKYGRSNLIDNFIIKFNLDTKISKELLLRSFINIKLQIKPFVYFLPLIQKIKIPSILITNGNVKQQKLKLRYLDISDKFTEIIFANNNKPKPDPECIYYYKKNYDSIIYIGDSNTDKEFALNSNIDLILINYLRDSFGFINEKSIYFEKYY